MTGTNTGIGVLPKGFWSRQIDQGDDTTETTIGPVSMADSKSFHLTLRNGQPFEPARVRVRWWLDEQQNELFWTDQFEVPPFGVPPTVASTKITGPCMSPWVSVEIRVQQTPDALAFFWTYLHGLSVQLPALREQRSDALLTWDKDRRGREHAYVLSAGTATTSNEQQDLDVGVNFDPLMTGQTGYTPPPGLRLTLTSVQIISGGAASEPRQLTVRLLAWPGADEFWSSEIQTAAGGGGQLTVPIPEGLVIPSGQEFRLFTQANGNVGYRVTFVGYLE